MAGHRAFRIPLPTPQRAPEPPAKNTFEARARRAKARRLADFLHDRVKVQTIDEVRAITPEQWEAIAKVLDMKQPPSELTQSLVITILKQRERVTSRGLVIDSNWQERVAENEEEEDF